MGDPKFPRRLYDTPTHPWDGPRIKEEDEFVRKYGLKNKRELWRAQTALRRFRGQARNLLPRMLRDEAQAKLESEQLLTRLNRIGIMESGATLADVLALDVDSILGRRLQTVVYRKGLARSPTQARQFISHGHISVRGRRVDVPGYVVTRNEEVEVAYTVDSALQNEMHPARPEAPAAPEPAEEAPPAPAPTPEPTPAPEPAPAEETPAPEPSEQGDAPAKPEEDS